MVRFVKTILAPDHTTGNLFCSFRMLRNQCSSPNNTTEKTRPSCAEWKTEKSNTKTTVMFFISALSAYVAQATLNVICIFFRRYYAFGVNFFFPDQTGTINKCRTFRCFWSFRANNKLVHTFGATLNGLRSIYCWPTRWWKVHTILQQFVSDEHMGPVSMKTKRISHNSFLFRRFNILIFFRFRFATERCAYAYFRVKVKFSVDYIWVLYLFELSFFLPIFFLSNERHEIYFFAKIRWNWRDFTS